MNKMMKKVGLGIALAATAATVAAPAEAQRWRGGYHGYHHGGIGTGGAALLGGIVGLGVGAAIASSNRGGYYDRGYYDRGYYRNGYYPRAGYVYDYPRRCWTERRFDPYYGYAVPVRVCG